MQSLEQDLKDVVEKVTGVLAKVQSAEPTLAEKLFAAVEQVFLDAGYTQPTEPATSAAPQE